MTYPLLFRRSNKFVEEAGLDTEGMAETVSTLRDELLALTGVDIQLDTDSFKSTYQILDEIAASWENLTDMERAATTELLAGKRLGNVMSGLMTNFDVARNALETARNSEGSAYAEHERAMNSIEGRITQFKASWESLSQTLISSDLVKGVVSFGTGFLTTIDSITQKLGSVPTVLTAIAAGMSAIKNVGEPINQFRNRRNRSTCLAARDFSEITNMLTKSLNVS